MEYEIRLLPEFEDWLDGLKDQLAQEAVAERLIRASRGNFGDHKSVNDGVSELRIRYGAGFRAYYTIRDREIVFMLVGGTKRTQDRDIARAKRLAKELRGQMALKTKAFEPERYFQTEDAQIRLVSNALESGDTAFLTDAIGIVARARGIAEIAEKTGLSRQALYAAFGPKGNPTISTVMKVLGVLGLTLEVKKAA